jgi:hypothetical protein
MRTRADTNMLSRVKSLESQKVRTDLQIQLESCGTLLG